MNLGEREIVQKIGEGRWYIAGFDIYQTSVGFIAVRMPSFRECRPTLEQAADFARAHAFEA